MTVFIPLSKMTQHEHAKLFHEHPRLAEAWEIRNRNDAQFGPFAEDPYAYKVDGLLEDAGNDELEPVHEVPLISAVGRITLAVMDKQQENI